jgi:hypothetical protein
LFLALEQILYSAIISISSFSSFFFPAPFFFVIVVVCSDQEIPFLLLGILSIPAAEKYGRAMLSQGMEKVSFQIDEEAEGKALGSWMGGFLWGS